MPYRRYDRCPLLTTHGRAFMLTLRGPVTRLLVADTLEISLAHAARLLAELQGEGLISNESAPGRRGQWSAIRSPNEIMTRLMKDGRPDK